jgi:hypothetical protein
VPQELVLLVPGPRYVRTLKRLPRKPTYIIDVISNFLEYFYPPVSLSQWPLPPEIRLVFEGIQKWEVIKDEKSVRRYGSDKRRVEVVSGTPGTDLVETPPSYDRHSIVDPRHPKKS